MCAQTPVLVRGNGCCGSELKAPRRHWFSRETPQAWSSSECPLTSLLLGIVHEANMMLLLSNVPPPSQKKGKKISALSSQHPSISRRVRHLSTRCWYECRNWYLWRFVACHFFQWECKHHSLQSWSWEGCRSRQGLVGKTWKLKKKESFKKLQDSA